MPFRNRRDGLERPPIFSECPVIHFLNEARKAGNALRKFPFRDKALIAVQLLIFNARRPSSGLRGLLEFTVLVLSLSPLRDNSESAA